MAQDAASVRSTAFDLEKYLTSGVENIVKNIIRATWSNPRQSAFMMRYALAVKDASEKRAAAEARGEHIPPFLIASITSSCNLHCAGCYARHNHACSDEVPNAQLTDAQWLAIFEQARELGIGFILLAGGEPLIRRDIIDAAGKIPEILFPIFTNGTMIDDEYLLLFDRCRNLVPVFSIEGRMEHTDARRGVGVYQRLTSAMNQLKNKQLLFGASVTVTTENLSEVVSPAFLQDLHQRDCKAVFYVEYVPVADDSQALAPTDAEREFLENRLQAIREEYPDMLFVSFPGDEKSSGGCLAAGRGFFHINSHGGAEPCPFSPYSDVNVTDVALKDALQSGLFLALQSEHMLTGEHSGGCVLYEQRAQVEALLNQTKQKSS